MTSAESVFIRRLLAIVSALCLFAGCQSPELVPPNVLVSPYDSSRGEALWAVAPLTNESGTTILEPTEVSDAIVRSVQQIEGVRCLSLNRVLAEMRALGIRSVGSPGEAAALIDRLGVNGLVVGTITDYDPYDPPRLGLSLVLENGASIEPAGGLNLDGLRGSVAGSPSGPTAVFSEAPAAGVAVVFDGRNHGTKLRLRRYAEGRHDPGSAHGWQTYLKSMPLFTEFAAHAAVGRLLDEERLRLARTRARQQVSSR